MGKACGWKQNATGEIKYNAFVPLFLEGKAALFMNPKLSLVIPSYNGADLLQANLPGVLAYLDELGISYEVLVVDDGSPDGGATERVAGQFNCRYLANPRNMGKGAAVRLGMLEAKGDFRIFTDADIPYEYDAIMDFLYYLDHKEFHMVIGDRTLPGSKYFGDVPYARGIGSKLYRFIVGRFVVSGVFDTQCGIKGFRAEVAQDLFGVSRLNRFAIDVELIYIAMKRNYDIKRLPVKLHSWGFSQVRAIRDGLNMLLDLIQILVNYYSGKYAPVKTVEVDEG
jgi:dolichyl-phosphate beta-glucosyltransferase